MINLIEWLMKVPEYKFIPLFSVDKDLVVQTQEKQTKQNDIRRLLMRSEAMESAIIEIVESGLGNPEWEGLFYIMGVNELPDFSIMYVGKAEKRGVKHELSVNLRNLRKNKSRFARWGDHLAYHIGDLSQALYEFKAYRGVARKYRKWAENLFITYDPPRLKQMVYFYVAPWYNGNKGPSGLNSSLPAVEKEIIALASVAFRKTLLNVDGT